MSKKIDEKIVFNLIMDYEKMMGRAIEAVATSEGVDSIQVKIKEGTLTVWGSANPVYLLENLKKVAGEAQLQTMGPVEDEKKDATTPPLESEAVDLVKDVFASAAERDIYTGDGLEIVVVNAEGVKREFLELRRD